MHKFKWNDLQFVHAVIEHGSLSAASRALEVNHATVLRRIASLEASSGVRLFDRSRDGYRLRPEGRALRSSLKLMDHASARIARNLALTSQGIEGTFRLATTDAIACLLLPGYLADLRQQHPGITIEVVVSNTAIDASLAAAEILIRPGTDLVADLSGVHAGLVDFAVFGAPTYLKASEGLAYERQNWLGAAPDFAQSTAGEWQFLKVTSRLEFSADSFLTLAALAARGLGLALLPTFVGDTTDGLQRVDAFANLPTTGLWVATHKEFRQQPAIETLLSFFAGALGEDLRPVPKDTPTET